MDHTAYTSESFPTCHVYDYSVVQETRQMQSLAKLTGLVARGWGGSGPVRFRLVVRFVWHYFVRGGNGDCFTVVFQNCFSSYFNSNATQRPLTFEAMPLIRLGELTAPPKPPVGLNWTRHLEPLHLIKVAMACLYIDDGDSFKLLWWKFSLPCSFLYNFTCIGLTLRVNCVCEICKLLLAKQLRLFL